MRISDFIEKLKVSVIQGLPGVSDVNISVSNSEEVFVFDIIANFSRNPSCILSEGSQKVNVAYLEVTLDTDLSYNVTRYYVYPGVNEDETTINISDFPEVLREILGRDRAQILIKSIIGE